MLAPIFAMVLAAAGPHAATCSVLVYHRFSPTVADSMTTTTAVFRQQVQAMRAGGYRIVPLAELVTVVQRRAPPAQGIAGIVAITVDDGHRTVHTALFPLLRELEIPVALFIYPSAIGRASYAMTWDQLRALAENPAVEIGAHTYGHPDFRQERRRLAPAAYAQFVAMQLARPRVLLREQLGVDARFLAWPYGIHDDDLMRQAREHGYAAAFALGNRNASAADPLFALPRHMVVDAVGVRGLMGRLAAGPACAP
jgi:peptidoglycan/xylan/chitin deacetylase (PgdA/CDA1 family)